ncbi:MAG: hypothetical protein NTY50_03985 [Methylobacter sp.]|nr:hypothetical protein [Methylobacter sp.]
MSSKDHIRQLALDAQTLPGFSLNDKAFHASQALNRDYFERCAKVHAAIKAFYLDQGHTDEQWQAIIANVQKFNRVWRQSLGLMPDDSPPPLAYRRVLSEPHLHQKNV